MLSSEGHDSMLMGDRPEARQSHPEDTLAWRSPRAPARGSKRPLPSPLSPGPADGRFRLPSPHYMILAGGGVLGEAGMSKRVSASRILQHGKGCQELLSWSIYAGPRLAPQDGQIPVETEGMSLILLPVVRPCS